MTVLAVPLVPLMISLGFWQLDRADEKRELLTQREALQASIPSRIEVGVAPKLYQPLELRGEFDRQRHFLLDNIVVNGRVGYDVLTPFTDVSGESVLVNRGWVAATSDRAIKPEFETPLGLQTIYAATAYHLKAPFLLEAQVQANDWPVVVQAVDTKLFSQSLSVDLAPYFARIEAGQQGGFVHHYKAVNIMPEKHSAYALQWFAMTIALVALYIYFGFSLPKHRSN